MIGCSRAGAAEFAVTNINDSGAGSLRQAMLDSNSTPGADVIRFQVDLGGTITLASELPIIVQSVTIQGPTAAAVMVSGNDSHRVFFVHAPAETVQINDLVISGGRASGGKGGECDDGKVAGAGGGGAGLGGGLLVTAGSVSVSDVAFLNNNATGGAGGSNTAWAGAGGGGGLGGDGGGGESNSGGGGGGVGETAAGGDSSYGGGIAGADGLLSTGAQAGSSTNGTAGGLTAGGGGGGAADSAGGGGGGDGGQAANLGVGGDGGFGGGGGGGSRGMNPSDGGQGGFGGGGGGGYTAGGDGGFGGGGGGSRDSIDLPGSGGFGGGAGDENFGGGGLGAGGAIYVQDGASLTISYSKNLAFSGNSVTAGSAGGTAQDGGAVGQAIFFGADAQISVAAGQSVIIADSLGGSAAGGTETDGGLVKTGAGTLALRGANTHVGGTNVNGGILDVAEDANLGNASSGISFDGGTVRFSNGFATARTVTLNAGGGTVDTAGSNTELSGGISGSGALTKTGNGTLTISGNNGAFNGATSINSGSLILNGTTASNMLIGTGTGFGGNGTVARLENRGTVAPGNSIGTTTVTGDYVHDASATYEVEINNSGQSDLIDVSGTATINGGTLDVQPEAGTYTPGTRYSILEADGGVSGEFDTLTGGVTGARLQLFYNVNNIELFLAPLYYAAARTPNQKAVSAVLERMAMDPTGDVSTVLTQLDTVINASGAEAYFDQLGGEVFGTTASVGIESTGLLLKTIGGRLRTMAAFEAARNGPMVRAYTARTLDEFDDTIIRGQASSRPCCGWRPWVQGYGVSSSVQGDGNASSFNYAIGGTTVAVDRALDRHTRLGIAGGYGASRIYLDGPAQRAYVDSGQFALYLQRRSCCRYWTGIFSYAHNKYDTARQLSFGNICRTASADYDGNECAFYLEHGRIFHWGAVQFQPYAALQYIGLRRSAFTETDAASMNLSVDARQTNSFRGILGSRLVWYDCSMAGRVAAPELRAFWRHEFLDEEPIVGAAFAGTPGSSFLISGAGLGRDAAVLGGGYTVYYGDHFSIFANYDLSLNNTEVAHIGTGGVQFLW